MTTSLQAKIVVDGNKLAAMRGQMLHFAQLQLHRDIAEDVVQEALEAALRNNAAYEGKSTLKTWVFAILKNKIRAYLRQHKRTMVFSELAKDDQQWEERLEKLFDDSGRWNPKMCPKVCPNPEEDMQTRHFWQKFEACLTHLPPTTARVFMMREFLDFETDEICEQLGINTSNCHVILYRARVRLRACLEASGW
ncbi:MAG: sigma-70 family RNA polymerase sigma factor [Mariprofundales bacterium]